VRPGDRYIRACAALGVDPVPGFGGPLTTEIIVDKPAYHAYQVELSKVAAQVEAAAGLPHGVLWFGYAEGRCSLSRGNMATPTVVSCGSDAVDALIAALEDAALDVAAARRAGAP
jgi:hypothetical protein